MKNLKRIAYLMIIPLSLILIGCTSEYEPIPGPPGADGIDGIDGVDSTTDCRSCHSSQHRGPIIASYEVSYHATSGLERFGTRGDNPDDPNPLANRCSRCHSNEGFIDYAFGGIDAVSSTGYYFPTAISCTTCHNKHRSFDFVNDGNDFALRKINPVQLETFPDYTIDLGGHSNLCINCHQPRDISPPTDNGNGMGLIQGSRFGPHHSPQSTIFEGIQLILIAGSESIPGVASSGHRQQSSCIQCHMGTTTGNEDGGHTFNPTLNACIQCHTSATDFDINGVQTEVTSLLDELEAILFANGVIDDRGRSIEGEYPIDIVNAYWNWKSIDEDGSKGVHNPDYVKAILKNSLESVKN